MRDDGLEPPAGVDESLRLTTEIVASYLAGNRIPQEQLPDLIRSIHRTIQGLASAEDPRLAERPKPAVQVNKSVHNDFIICLEDGKRLTMLKRYLRSTYNMSPEDYRKRWGLPADYPMVAPAYAAQRSDHAKRIGLGKGVRRKSS